MQSEYSLPLSGAEVFVTGDTRGGKKASQISLVCENYNIQVLMNSKCPGNPFHREEASFEGGSHHCSKGLRKQC